MTEKLCTKCKIIKPVSCFGVKKQVRSGLRGECKPCQYAYNKKYREAHPEKVRGAVKRAVDKFRKNPANKDKLSKWRRENPERYRAYQNHYYHTKLKHNIVHRLRMALVSRIRYAISTKYRGHGSKVWSDFGFTVKELKSHLSSLFVEGMTWDNYGKWEIDHIIPVSFFKYTTTKDTEFKMCWRLENLQPLWAEDNRKKAAKIISAA